MTDKKLIKILVVDDEKALREILRRSLTQIGYTCFEADSGKTALNMYDAEPFHMIITDIMMPEMNGIEVLFHLKEKDPDIAAVMMTGYGTVEHAINAMKLGASDFLNKPVDFDVLPYVVEAALEKRRLIIENREHRIILEETVEERTRQLNNSLKDLRRNFTETIKVFTGLIERRDPHIGSHSKRVAVSCRGICENYDLPENIRHDIEIGALLHDIGKIAIPDSLLKKSVSFLLRTKLDSAEEKLIRQHPIVGQDTVEQIEILRSMGLIIRHHHEYFNGSGYPDGLKGDAIPFGSRMICVANAYDNVVYMVEETRREKARLIVTGHLRKNAGILYDPTVVELFLEYFEEARLRHQPGRESRINVEELQPGMVLARDISSSDGIMLLPQFETLDEMAIERIKRFHEKRPLVGGAYVYQAGSENSMQKKKKSASDGAVSDEQGITFQQVKEAIDSTSDLKTLPFVYNSVSALLADQTSTKGDIAKVLRTDQVIMAKILRIVNSALFGFSRKVTTIEDAIPLLGLNEIENIVLSVSVIGVFNMSESGGFDRSEFWKHSLGCGIISKLLALRTGALHPDEFFSAGLLHDIGKITLDQLFPDEFLGVLELTKSRAMFLRNAERKVFGQTHPNVGKYLLQRWKIPDVLVEAVAFHHGPSSSTINPVLVSAVQVADVITHLLHIGNSGENVIPKFDEFALKNLNITLAGIETLVPEIDAQVKESEDLLLLES